MKTLYILAAVVALLWLYSWRWVETTDGPLTVRGTMTPVAPLFVRAHATVTNHSDREVQVVVPCRNPVEIRGIGWFTTGPRCYRGTVALKPGATAEAHVEGLAFCLLGPCDAVTGYHDSAAKERRVRVRFRILGLL